MTFNQIVGGSANGWRHLVDSSLDWGQDLPGLAQWLERNNPGPSRASVFLAYFGTGDPRHEGMVVHTLSRLPRLGPEQPGEALTGGIYCVSATMRTSKRFSTGTRRMISSVWPLLLARMARSPRAQRPRSPWTA